LTAIAAVTSAMPHTGAPRRVISAPAASMPTTSRSLCAPPIMWMTIIGLATASHSASAGRPPRRRLSSGSAHSSRASPGSIASRISSTPRTTLSPTSAVTDLASRMNSGP
jgi:hypothetical protein